MRVGACGFPPASCAKALNCRVTKILHNEGGRVRIPSHILRNNNELPHDKFMTRYVRAALILPRVQIQK
jgi:hypothetical protein